MGMGVPLPLHGFKCEQKLSPAQNPQLSALGQSSRRRWQPKTPPGTAPESGCGAGTGGDVTSGHPEDTAGHRHHPCQGVISTCPLSSPRAQRGRQIRCLENVLPKTVEVVTMEIKKGSSAQLHQNIYLPPRVSQATY